MEKKEATFFFTKVSIGHLLAPIIARNSPEQKALPQPMKRLLKGSRDGNPLREIAEAFSLALSVFTACTGKKCFQNMVFFHDVTVSQHGVLESFAM